MSADQENSMYSYPRYEVDIAREVAIERLSWPERGEATDENCLGGNRQYLDLRRFSWSEAKAVYEAEEKLIARIENAVDPDAEYEAIENEDEPNDIWGLDIGVASSVFALSAARCIPFSSCNGGAFGGHHHEEHPLVAFYTRPELVKLLLQCAEEANAGLVSYKSGEVIIYANDIRDMRVFAQILIRKRAIFGAIRLQRQRVNKLSGDLNNKDKESNILKQLKLL